MPISASDISLRACPAGRLSGPISGIVFDAGDVLYDATVWRRWLLQLLARLGVHSTYRCFWHVWDQEYLAEVHRGRRDFCEAFRQFLLAVGLTDGQIDEVERACQGRRNECGPDVRLLPGVRSTLTRLGATGIPMVVLSDSELTGAELLDRLECLGLKNVFVDVVSSLDLGQTKPAAACYSAALERIRIAPEHAVFVGHDAAVTGQGRQPIRRDPPKLSITLVNEPGTGKC